MKFTNYNDYDDYNEYTIYDTGRDEWKEQSRSFIKLRSKAQAEAKLREKHPGLKEAWEKYQTLLELCKYENA